MLRDRYDNPVTTTSQAARDAYDDGVSRFLAAEAGVFEAFDRAIEADPGFALAHLARARQSQMIADRDGVKASLTAARESAGGVTEREAAQLHCMGLLLEGRIPEAYPAIRAHARAYPRDAMVVQTCCGVFGLIGFSGQPGREAEQLAFTNELLPHYGEDWWFLGMHAFSQCEVGQLGPAAETIERSLAGNPRSAHSAHIKAHVHYEVGETDAGRAYMSEWWRDYSKNGLLHCHVSWHIALWALEAGETDLMWEMIDNHVAPGSSTSPPINILSDSASILYRASLSGVDVPAGRWKAVSDYAAQFFPKPGIAFADVHAALAHAMAGNAEALEKIIRDARGPAGDRVATLAEAFGAIAAGRWKEASGHLAHVLVDHERIGGSRAQRDLIEYALLGTLLKQGLVDEARLMLETRRPVKMAAHAVKGL